jgi:hypothetical protein
MRTALLVLMSAGAVLACEGGAKTAAGAAQPAAGSALVANAGAVTPAAPPARQTAAPAASASLAAIESAGAPRRYREVRIPAGTLLQVTTETSVASDRSRVEDPVRARLRAPVRVNGVTAIPAGSKLRGTVVDSVRSGKVKGRARVAFRFESITIAGEAYDISTSTVSRVAPGTKKQDAAKIGMPAAGGAIIGAIAGGKKGAAIGGAVGGGAGTAVVLSTRGKEVGVPAGRALSVRLREPLTVRIPVRD